MGKGFTPEELAEWEAKRRREREETAKKLGVTADWLEKKEAEARAELDDEWEQELNRKYREKAGIKN